MDEIEELQENRELLFNTLTASQEPFVVGSIELFLGVVKNREVLVCFSQPTVDELKTILELEKEVLFL